MKISFENLGALEQASFELADFTIMCGMNNTGKTYATYAMYGFLDFWHEGYELPVEKEQILALMNHGVASIALKPIAQSHARILKDASTEYIQHLDKIFASKRAAFNNTVFNVEISAINNYLDIETFEQIGINEKKVLQFSKKKGEDFLIVALTLDKEKDEMPPNFIFRNAISDKIKEIMFSVSLPKTFISSAERTGSAIFQKELDFTRNRLVDFLGEKSAKITPLMLLGKFIQDYPIAVRKNVDFIRSIPQITSQRSFIAEQHPELLDYFKKIIGGGYRVSKDGELEYTPSKKSNLKLSLVESSSAVRSLLDIGFYLHHIAQPGDLLIVDEPELNLHPSNQRLITRLFARLSNIGIKIFITTHSDYIIRELNTLIMLNKDEPEIKKIAEREGYVQDEFLSAEKLKVYIASTELVQTLGASRKRRIQTIVPAYIDDFYGIELQSFDKTIEEMNRIQESIIWRDNNNE